MKNILQFGTFDVHNFGDLLFPLLAQDTLSKACDATIVPVSPVGGTPAELQDCLTPRMLVELLESDLSFHAALIGGGNIVHCLPTALPFYTAAKKSSFAYSDLWIAPSVSLPSRCPILWNAPGVPNRFMAHQRDLVRRSLSAASYLSVRDELSREYLLEVDAKAQISVVPDTAWNLDLLWSKQDLKREYDSFFEKAETQPPHSIVIFHVNRRYLSGMHMDGLGRELDKIAEHFDAKAVLIPLAPCHGDVLLAHQLASAMTSRVLVLDSPSSLRVVAALIANAKAYIGSSMHGLVTAAVYGIPGICVANPSMAKFQGLSNFVGRDDLVVENWSTASELVSSSGFQERSEDFAAAKKRAEQLLQDHWHRIAEIVNSQSSLIAFTLRESNEHTRFIRAMAGYKDEVCDVILEGESQSRSELQQEWAERLDAASDLHSAEMASVQASSHADMRRVKAELLRLETSFSWRITRPLRMLSRRYPNFASTILEAAGRIYRRVKSPLTPPSPNQVSIWRIPPDMRSRIEKYKARGVGSSMKIVVYTAVFGDYDRLLLPEQLNLDVDYVCFTDRPLDTFGVWHLRDSPFYHVDPTRIARYIKTHPHTLFPEYDYAIWIDANIVLRADPQKYLGMVNAAGRRLGLIPHPHRDCVYEEIEACKLLAKDSHASLDGQAAYYRSQGLEEHGGIYETGFMVADLRDGHLSSFFSDWWRQIESYSRRDQVGLAWTLRSHPLEVCDLLPQGVSVREHEDFTYYSHKNARRLRTPVELQPFSLIKAPWGEGTFSLYKNERLDAVSDRAVDIVICVYNALEDVKRCISSVLADLRNAHHLIIVNDCSDEETTAYLRSIRGSSGRITLIENSVNLGYTRSANKGLSAGKADFRIILNSDTVVSKNWALKLLDAAARNEAIGIVGPLSNAAGVQSVPRIKGTANNTAINILPPGISFEDVDEFLENTSDANLFPVVPLVHGFCMGIKSEVFETIGYFDAENFSRYYGEENDFCLRANAAGYSMALATNTFVFHRKSRSIAEEERLIHMEQAGRRLREIYGTEKIREVCQQGEDHPVLINLRGKVEEYYMRRRGPLA